MSLTIRETLQLIRRDLDRYSYLNGRSHFYALLMIPGAQATIIYRLRHWLFIKEPRLVHTKLLSTMFTLLNRFVEVITGISINPSAEIGSGLYIGHFGSIFIGSNVRLGTNCNLSQEVTIGIGGREPARGSPTIGDRVYIAPGAKLFGAIHVGDDVAIGANAVVTKSLPDRAVAIGVPAYISSLMGSFGFIQYRDMLSDRHRINSQELASREDGLINDD